MVLQAAGRSRSAVNFQSFPEIKIHPPESDSKGRDSSPVVKSSNPKGRDSSPRSSNPKKQDSSPVSAHKTGVSHLSSDTDEDTKNKLKEMLKKGKR
jgi:hypothetical protein